ncbi:MAG: hypothetical protein WC596_01210 [Candidatus Shapirobacteria bacterium]
MFQKILFIGFIVSFCSQILFSLFYSQEIVRQNTLLQKQLEVQNSLTLQEQLLENQLAKFSSIELINQTLQKDNYQPILQTINLHDSSQP